jgi:hypothetical protein
MQKRRKGLMMKTKESMLLIMQLICCVLLIGCQASRPPIAVKGIDYEDWRDGGICLSQDYAKRYLHWKNHR